MEVQPAPPGEVDLGDLNGRGLEVASLRVGGRELLVAVADTPAKRSRGLMGVEDLGELDGMLFVWGGDTVQSGFTMRNTLIGLDLILFDREGSYLETLRMVPCTGEPCPVYRPSRPYAYALEVPAGRLPDPGDLELTVPVGG